MCGLLQSSSKYVFSDESAQSRLGFSFAVVFLCCWIAERKIKTGCSLRLRAKDDCLCSASTSDGLPAARPAH